MLLVSFSFVSAAELPRGAQADLIAGPQQEDGSWSAGLSVDLPAGFKTYWRVPGDSGVAPRFDWSGSDNLKAADVAFPAPQRYADEAGETIGYAAPVLFPLRVVAHDPARPVHLALALDIAICEDICIPAHAALDLTLDPAAPADPGSARRIAVAQADVPRAPEAGDPTITEARLAGETLEMALSAALNPAATDIFIEGPPLVSFGKPEPADGVGSRYRIAVSAFAPQDIADLRGQTLTATLVSGPIRLALPFAVP